MRATTLAFSAQKGGVGKTTTSLTVSAYLARKGHKVLLIDLDGQCNATFVLMPDYGTLKEVETVAAMLADDFEEIGKTVVYQTKIPNLEIIPSHPRLSEAETILNGLTLRENRLAYMIEPLKSLYEYIIIDCPPNINMLPVNAWVVADFIIIPVEPSAFDLEGLKFLHGKIATIKKLLNKNLEILGYLTTKFVVKTSISGEVFELLKKNYGGKVFETKIPVNTDLQKANGNHIDIFGYNPRAHGAIAYKAFIEKELLPRLNLNHNK